MDKTVIVLIGAGVCCVVIGLALFVKLLTTKQDESEDTNGNKKLLDNEYAENFKECFEDTGDIEDTLDQLATIYTGNQYMYNLIVNALDFIRDEQGDYETALDEINVDNDSNIANMHNAAIKKALNLESRSTIARKPKETKNANKNEEPHITENFDEDDDCESEKDDAIGSEHQNNKADKAVGMIPTETEVIADDFKEFDEDDEDDEEDEIIPETQKKESVSITKPEKIEEKEKPKKVTKKRPAKKPVILDEEDDEEEDDDLDGFKIG